MKTECVCLPESTTHIELREKAPLPLVKAVRPPSSAELEEDRGHVKISGSSTCCHTAGLISTSRFWFAIRLRRGLEREGFPCGGYPFRDGAQSTFPLAKGIAHTFTFTSAQLNWTVMPYCVWEIKHAACTWLPFLCLPCVRVCEEVPAPNTLHSHFLCFPSSAPAHLLLPRLSVCLMLVSSGLTDTNSKVSVEMDPGLFDLAVLFFSPSLPFWRWVLLPLSALASLFLFLFLPKLLGWSLEIF